MRALIDADTPIVASALSAKDDDLFIAISRLDRTINNIINDSGCTEYTLFVSGSNNFRYEIDKEYKANRPKEPIKWRKECKQHLIRQWGAVDTEGYEADDAVGCEQKLDGSTIICGIDKDLLMIPGKHYNWPLTRSGKVIREKQYPEVSIDEGMKKFFTQVITGDATDNIIGIYRMGKKRAEAYLKDVTSEEDLYEAVLSLYKEHNREKDFYKNCNLLWIWRDYGETYSVRRDLYA